ncbi:MAG: hypothetical protein MUP14_02740 [Dehalococcoidia bacterium]|nr:hypothetical protein [Dehalococcoidia bacterium]
MTGPGLISAVPLLRRAFQWLLVTLFALSLIAFFLVINAMQLTSPGTAQRILSRAVADLTEIDAALPTIQADLAEEAQASQQATVTVPHFPIAVELPRAEATTISTAELRSRLLSEAAAAIYKDGMSVWAADDPEAKQNIDLLSPEGAVQRGLGLLSDDNHHALRIAAIVLGLISFILGGLVFVSTKGMSRVVALGAGLLGAAVPSLTAAVAARFVFFTASEDQHDYLIARLLDLGNDASWLALRNYTILTLVGLWLVVLGFGLVLVEIRQRAISAATAVDNSSPEA